MSESGKPVLVTGASGFVGSHLVEELVRQGKPVRAFLREGSSDRWLPNSPLVQPFRGSLRSADSLASAVQGVDAVYHLAAVTSAPSERAYVEANVGGTEALVRALQRAAPEARLVLCSTLAAAGPAREGRPVTERDTPAPITPYGRSKLAAEQYALASGVPVIVIRPPTVYGPRDRDILEMFRWAARGILPVVGAADQLLSMIHVHDLARALAAAGRATSAPGAIYFVDDGQIHTRTGILRAIEDAVGKRTFRVRIPVPIALLLAHAQSGLAAITGAKPLLTTGRIQDMTITHWTCDSTLARTALGFTPEIPLERGLSETGAWYREQGWI